MKVRHAAPATGTILALLFITAAFGLPWWAPFAAYALVLGFRAGATTRPHHVTAARERKMPAPKPACQHERAHEVWSQPVPAVGYKAELVAWWCPDCETQLGRHRGLCAQCRKPITHPVGLCGECLRRPPGWSRPVRETREEIEAAGHEAIRVDSLGMPEPRWVRGQEIVKRQRPFDARD